MSDLIVFAVLSMTVITALVVVIAIQARAAHKTAEATRIEREHLVLAVMSRSAPEYAIAEARIRDKTASDINSGLIEPPVGL